jgi:hypothetical protein
MNGGLIVFDECPQPADRISLPLHDLIQNSGYSFSKMSRPFLKMNGSLFNKNDARKPLSEGRCVCPVRQA